MEYYIARYYVNVGRKLGMIRMIKGIKGEYHQLINQLIDNTLCGTAQATWGGYSQHEDIWNLVMFKLVNLQIYVGTDCC